ncbi:MAG TPA: PadR family transcriptional regulator [Candidatus Eremiobacteraceae bacterium]|jgi:DNA-binding PadR family transcriptional regulator|nr:PadR family transcriptional regulator [Candidatus Eremiobacteraceae bacterium]
MKHDLHAFLPLSPAELHILLALAPEDLHGYGIMQEVTRQSQGKYKLGPGTLYDNLKKLMNHHLVDESAKATTSISTDDRDSRRRYYRLTTVGRKVLAAEVERLEEVLREAKAHLHALKPRRA